jgi:hypothetical protein
LSAGTEIATALLLFHTIKISFCWFRLQDDKKLNTKKQAIFLTGQRKIGEAL